MGYLSFVMVVTLEPGKAGSPCISQRKAAAWPLALSRCTSEARLPLLVLSLRMSSAAWLLGKALEDSNRNVVIVVVHWRLPRWESCE